MLNDHLSEYELQRIADKQSIPAAGGHLAMCPDCRERLQDYQTIIEQVVMEDRVELSDDFERKVLRRIRRTDLIKGIAKVLFYGVGLVAGLLVCAYFVDVESVLSSFRRIEILAMIERYADLGPLKVYNNALILIGIFIFVSLNVLDVALQHTLRRFRSM